MEIFNARRITNIGVVAALYVVVTLIGAPLAYGGVQFRVSEALMLLCLFNKDYIISLTLGCFISNIFSTVGAIDTVVGTSATLIAAILIYLVRNKKSLLLASVFPVVLNGVFVGLELYYVAKLPLLLTMAQVAFGEIVCVSILGVILFRILGKNQQFIKLITTGNSQLKV